MEAFYADLSYIQNGNTLIDIMTITGFMSEDQKIAHIIHYASRDMSEKGKAILAKYSE